MVHSEVWGWIWFDGGSWSRPTFPQHRFSGRKLVITFFPCMSTIGTVIHQNNTLQGLRRKTSSESSNFLAFPIVNMTVEICFDCRASSISSSLDDSSASNCLLISYTLWRPVHRTLITQQSGLLNNCFTPLNRKLRRCVLDINTTRIMNEPPSRHVCCIDMMWNWKNGQQQQHCSLIWPSKSELHTAEIFTRRVTVDQAEGLCHRIT